MLGDGPDLVFGEAAEGLADELEVVREVGGPAAVLDAVVGQAFEEGRRPVLGDEGHCICEGVTLDAPCLAATEHAGRNIVHRVGDIGTGEHRLDLAVLAITAHDPRALDRGGGVRKVVRDCLMPIERGDRDLAVLGGELGEPARGTVDNGAGPIDGRGCCTQLVAHAGKVTDRPTPRPSAAALKVLRSPASS